MEYRLGLNYFEIPVHLVYQIFRNFEIEVGPYWGYLLNPYVETSISSYYGNFQYLNSLDKSDFQRSDLGFSLGVRVRFDQLYLGFSYKVGMESVSTENNFTNVLLGEAANRNFQLYAAFQF